MKITSINARVDSAGKHNDRNFDLNAAPHIDKGRSSANKYYTYNGDESSTFRQIEMSFYKDTFSEHLKYQNKKNKENGHKDRNRDVRSYYSDRFTRPEDKILQIGDVHNHVSPDVLWECALDYKDRFNDLYGEHCKILDMALHVDEATPHVHIRRVWVAEDEKGYAQISQNKALAALGVEAPDPTAKTDRHNNAKMTFTYSDRELFCSVCKEHGLDIEEPVKRKAPRKHLSDIEYKISMREKEYEQLEREYKAVEKELKELDESMEELINTMESQPEMAGDYSGQMELLRKKSRAEKLRTIAKIYREEMNAALQRAGSFEKAAARHDIDKEVRHMERFLDNKGLLDEYRESEIAGRRERTQEHIKEKKESKKNNETGNLF